MVAPNIVAIIPARGGSKRIPKKNIIDLGGKPMIAWTIEAALKSTYISTVVVSTDDEEIAAISRAHGAYVPFLRNGNADDHSPVSLATIRTLNQLDEINFKKPDITVQLMANCPLRSYININQSIKRFVTEDYDFQISCFKYGWMNPWWAYTIDNKNNPTPIFKDEDRVQRSQDLPELYCPTGAIWVAKTAELLKAETFYGPGHKFFELPWTNAIDIDDYDDLKMTKILMSDKW